MADLVSAPLTSKDQSRVPYTSPHVQDNSNVAANAPTLGSPVVPAGLRPAPNPRNPMMSAAFAQAPRAFNPTTTAFAAK